MVTLLADCWMLIIFCFKELFKPGVRAVASVLLAESCFLLSCNGGFHSVAKQIGVPVLFMLTALLRPRRL